jgi:hypothetical protein
MQRRHKESLATLKKKLTSLANTADTVERPEQAAASVFSCCDISTPLKKMGLHVIDYGEPRKVPIGMSYLFHVRATFSSSPEKGESGSKMLMETQARITQVLKTVFGAEDGPYPFTYALPGDYSSHWLPGPKDRCNAGMAQLKNIEAALAKANIRAELGLRN